MFPAPETFEYEQAVKDAQREATEYAHRYMDGVRAKRRNAA
jgi:hypothetical protein